MAPDALRPDHLALRCALLLIACTVVADIARAAPIYRCRQPDATLAFQDRPCVDAQQQREIELPPAPAAQPSPDYGIAKKAAANSMFAHSRRTPTHAEPVSWECRAAGGEVFYQHTHCPATITHTDAHPRGRGRTSAKTTLAVTSTPLPRAEACRRMQGGGAAGRSLRDHDQAVSTYERNLGRDPCR